MRHAGRSRRTPSCFAVVRAPDNDMAIRMGNVPGSEQSVVDIVILDEKFIVRLAEVRMRLDAVSWAYQLTLRLIFSPDTLRAAQRIDQVDVVPGTDRLVRADRTAGVAIGADLGNGERQDNCPSV